MGKHNFDGVKKDVYSLTVTQKCTMSDLITIVQISKCYKSKESIWNIEF